jgi:hypothetical protein
MTHEQLLVKVFALDPAWDLDKDFVEKNKALRAVVELHSPTDDNCQECDTAYPCPTIEAIVNEFK